MNNKGQWYLVYTDMHDSDVRIGGVNSYNTFEYEKEVEILLGAKTEEEAILEGTAKWKDIFVMATAQWEEEIKKRCTDPDRNPHSPRTAFNGANPNPHIIYKVSL